MSRLQGIPQLPFHPRPQRSTGKLASASPGPPAPEPLDPRALDPGPPWGTLPRDPRTSPQGWLSPETSCTAAGSESHPQVIPPLSGDGGGGDGGGCDPNGPLHAPGRAAGGRGASHAGRGRWGGARSPSRTEPREPGTRAPGGELGGGVPGRAPAAALLPAERADARHQSRGRRAPAETEAGRRGRGSPPAPRRGVRAQPARSAAGRAVPLHRGGTLGALAPTRHLSARSTRTPLQASAAEASSSADPVRASCLSQTPRLQSDLHSLSPHLRSPRRGGIPGRCTLCTFPGSRLCPAPAAYLLRNHLVLLLWC